MKYLVTVFTFFLLLSSYCISKVWEVPGDCPTIKAGIDSCSTGDTVMVSPGTYVENIDFLGKAIVVISEYGPDSTVIDGNQEGSVVKFVSGETVKSVIEGFTITNGSGTFLDLYWEYAGGGIFCNGSAPTIQYNIITGNTANNGGGIAAVYNSPVVITHNIIFGNSANVTPGKIGGGGGTAIGFDSDAEVSHNDIYNNFSGKAGGGIAFGFDCNPKVMNNTIRDNVSNDYGGGIQIYSYTAGTFENNIIKGNSSLGSSGAGGISCRFGSYPKIANNIIVDNSAATHGGGIRCFEDATPTITNNLVIGNDAGISGGGIECDNGAFTTITNTILWNNVAPAGTEMWIGPRSGPSAVLTISYSDVKGGMVSVYVNPGSTLNWGPGMIDTNPLFRSLGVGDFHLMAIACGDSVNSPCIDMGDPNILDSLFDCSWGLGTERSDMGAYGGGDSVLVGVNTQEIEIPKEHHLSYNYPNPFNSTTKIRYDIREWSYVTLKVYDVIGSEIASLVKKVQPQGNYEIEFDSTELTSGIYFYRLQAVSFDRKAGDFIGTKKMVLLK